MPGETEAPVPARKIKDSPWEIGFTLTGREERRGEKPMFLSSVKQSSLLMALCDMSSVQVGLT